MRKSRWRGSPGKDRVKEASKRLQAIMRYSRKLRVAPKDLSGLDAVSCLRTSSEGEQEPVTWSMLGILAAGVLLSVLLLLTVGKGLLEGFTCANSSTKEIQVQTVRLDHLSAEGNRGHAEESILFNDSGDSDRWQPGRLRMREDR